MAAAPILYGKKNPHTRSVCGFFLSDLGFSQSAVNIPAEQGVQH